MGEEHEQFIHKGGNKYHRPINFLKYLHQKLSTNCKLREMLA